jgi:hypothetical protein
MVTWRNLLAVSLLILSLVVAAGCGTAASQTDLHRSPVPQRSSVPAVSSVLPTPTPIPSPTLTPVPLHLVMLHTNDNWGEIDPCG